MQDLHSNRQYFSANTQEYILQSGIIRRLKELTIILLRQFPEKTEKSQTKFTHEKIYIKVLNRQNFMLTRLHTNKQFKVWLKEQNALFEEKLKVNTANPKQLLETLKNKVYRTKFDHLATSMSFKTFIQFCQQFKQKTYSCSEQVWPSVCRNVLQKIA